MRISRLSGAMLLLSSIASGAFAQPFDRKSEEWIHQPEAYFVTDAEKAEWKTTAPADRDAFRERYWLRRDPTPGTARNEFRETVEGRIKVADERFTMFGIRGSRTAHGYVFVVFGSPAIASSGYQPRPGAPRTPSPGDSGYTAVGQAEGTESESKWVYNRERTREVLEQIGRPSLDVNIIIDPNRETDRLQNPGLVNRYREVLAQKSITNPQMIRAASRALPLLSAGLEGKLPSGEAAVKDVRSGYVLRTYGSAPAYASWFAVPDSALQSQSKLRITTVVHATSGEEKFFEATVTPSEEFTVAGKARSFGALIPVPEGTSTIRSVLHEESGRVLATSEQTVTVAPPNAFDVSSLIGTAGPVAAEEGETSAFLFGPARIAPRADATFRQSESLWYFAEVQGAPRDGVMLVQRIRRPDGKMSATPPFKADLQPSTDGRSMFGYELPLQQMEPGSYSLYLEVRVPGRDPVVRRLDFSVISG